MSIYFKTEKMHATPKCSTYSGPLNPGGQSHFPVTGSQIAPFLQGHSSRQLMPKL